MQQKKLYYGEILKEGKSEKNLKFKMIFLQRFLEKKNEKEKKSNRESCLYWKIDKYILCLPSFYPWWPSVEMTKERFAIANLFIK